MRCRHRTMVTSDSCHLAAPQGCQNISESLQSKNYSLLGYNSGSHSTSRQHRLQLMTQSRVLAGTLLMSKPEMMVKRSETDHSISTSHSSIPLHDLGPRQHPSLRMVLGWNHRVFFCFGKRLLGWHDGVDVRARGICCACTSVVSRLDQSHRRFWDRLA